MNSYDLIIIQFNESLLCTISIVADMDDAKFVRYDFIY
jgi:hypothetical protein